MVTRQQDVARMAQYIRNILIDVGIDMEDQNFKDTPQRWISYLQHYLQPYDPREDLSKHFDEVVKGTYSHSMVVQCNIPFRAVCAHHLVPVLGTAHVGYIPKSKVVGISKLSRLVYGISHRMPSLQEDVCNEVTTALMQHLIPLGAMCVIKAEHGCMACRGVEEQHVYTATASVKGVFVEPEIRSEFYKLIALG